MDSARPLNSRTILIAPAGARADFGAELERSGARVIACPESEPAEPESHASLDEAIENLYGYDWLIFTSVYGVEYFLRRVQHLGHEIDELDSLRVCGTGAATARKLEESHIHVDVIPEPGTSEGILAALENYAGGFTVLRRLNFLMPRAAIGRDRLAALLEDAGARVDLVVAYRTVRGDNQELARIDTLLVGGGIDCVVFTSAHSIERFAQLFDTSDLSLLLRGVAVACIDDATAQTATQFGLHADVISSQTTATALVASLTAHLGGTRH